MGVIRICPVWVHSVWVRLKCIWRTAPDSGTTNNRNNRNERRRTKQPIYFIVYY